MRSNLKSRLKVSVISLILILLLTEASPAHRNESYSHDGGRQTCQPCWMKYLKDDVRLSELSIPGTHETMSFYGGDAVQTQSMALNFQLESGIRVLDIRCAIVEIRNPTEPPGAFFNIYHGAFYQRANFDDVLNRVVAFLRRYPHETVFMRVKEERTNDPDRFEDVFRRRYWNREEYKKHFWKFTSENPTLGELRGKIVVLQDFARWQCKAPLPNGEFGLCYNSFDIEDTFVLGMTEDLYKKWILVKNHLAAANSADHPDTKYMNYLTGSRGVFPYFVVSGHSDPRTSAPRLATRRRTDNRDFWRDFPRFHCAGSHCTIFYEGTNTLTYDRLGTDYKNRVGIIMTDFPGWGLLNRTIDLNARFRKPNQRPECGENSPRICSTPPPKRQLRTR